MVLIGLHLDEKYWRMYDYAMINAMGNEYMRRRGRNNGNGNGGRKDKDLVEFKMTDIVIDQDPGIEPVI